MRSRAILVNATMPTYDYYISRHEVRTKGIESEWRFVLKTEAAKSWRGGFRGSVVGARSICGMHYSTAILVGNTCGMSRAPAELNSKWPIACHRQPSHLSHHQQHCRYLIAFSTTKPSPYSAPGDHEGLSPRARLRPLPLVLLAP